MRWYRKSYNPIYQHIPHLLIVLGRVGNYKNVGKCIEN